MTKKYSGCGSNIHIRPLMSNRRDFLHVGLVGGLGLSLPELLRMEANAAQKHYESKEGPAKSVIHIFLPGGMAQQESFDAKPYAPTEYRGPLNPLAPRSLEPGLDQTSRTLRQLQTNLSS